MTPSRARSASPTALLSRRGYDIGEPDGREGVVHGLAVGATGRGERSPAGQPAGGHHLAHGGGYAGRGADPLGDETHPPPVVEVLARGAEQPHLAPGDRDQTHHRPHQGGLAGAVGAQHGQHLTLSHGQLDAAQDRAAAELDGAVGDLHHGLAHEHWSAFRRVTRLRRIKDR